MSGTLTKIAADAALATLQTAGATLRKLASENAAKDAKIEELEKELHQRDIKDRITKTAQEVHELGFDEGRSFEETVAFLEETEKSGELDTFVGAVKLASGPSILGTPSDRNTGQDPLEAAVFDEG